MAKVIRRKRKNQGKKKEANPDTLTSKSHADYNLFGILHGMGRKTRVSQ